MVGWYVGLWCIVVVVWVLGDVVGVYDVFVVEGWCEDGGVVWYWEVVEGFVWCVG